MDRQELFCLPRTLAVVGHRQAGITRVIALVQKRGYEVRALPCVGFLSTAYVMRRIATAWRANACVKTRSNTATRLSVSTGFSGMGEAAGVRGVYNPTDQQLEMPFVT